MTEMIEVYIRSSQNYVNEIVAGLAEQNYKKIEDAAHPLKSSSATLGAIGFAALASEIEDRVLCETLDDQSKIILKQQVETLLSSFESVQNFFKSQNLGA